MPPTCTKDTGPCDWCDSHIGFINKHVKQYVAGCPTHPQPWTNPLAGAGCSCTIDHVTGAWVRNPTCPIHSTVCV